MHLRISFSVTSWAYCYIDVGEHCLGRHQAITFLEELCCVMARHYDDVIMGAMVSQIPSLAIVYSTVYSGTDQRKQQSSASLAFVRGIHRFSVMASNAENVWWRHHHFKKNCCCSCRNYAKSCCPWVIELAQSICTQIFNRYEMYIIFTGETKVNYMPRTALLTYTIVISVAGIWNFSNIGCQRPQEAMQTCTSQGQDGFTVRMNWTT